MNRFARLGVLFLITLGGLFISPVHGREPQIVSVKKIWDQAPHNAFTDLIRFQDRWFCTFREADSHAGGEDGKIRVIFSPIGEHWESTALLVEEGVDLRDPKLSQTPDGRLMLVAGGSLFEGEVYQTCAPRVSFSLDGFSWSTLRKVLAEDHWLWRVTWHRGTAYSISKLGAGRNPRRVMLYSSQDGVEWTWLTELRDIPPYPNEATIRFLSGDEMMVLLRRNATGWIGTSSPPYKQWKWYDTGHQLGGPNFIQLPNRQLWAGSRSYSHSKGVTKHAGTILARMDRNRYEPVLNLPSGGDASYPGMVWHQDLLWVSYYSSHEEKTSIYLSKVRIP